MSKFESSSSNELIAQNNNHKTYTAHLSHYRYTKINLDNLSGTTVPLSLNSSQQIQFKIPNGIPFNLGQSYITYSYTVPAGGAVNYSAIFQNNQDMFAQISFGDNSLAINDIQYADRYTSMILPIKTPHEILLCKDALTTFYATNQTNVQNVTPFSLDNLTVGNLNTSSQSYSEPQYLTFSSAVNTALTVTRMLPLATFVDTVIGMDKNQIFNTEMYLRGLSQVGIKLGFNCLNLSSPNATQTAFTSLTMPPQFNNVVLYLAVEQNNVIIDQLRHALASNSIKYKIPATVGYRYATTSSVTSITLPLGKGLGHKLKRVMTGLFVGSEQGAWSFDHSNVNGTKVTSLNSAMDSRVLYDSYNVCFNPLVNINLNATSGFTNTTYPNSDDYREMRKWLLGSSLPSYLSYQINWVWIDSWGVNPTINAFTQRVPDENISDGFNLEDSSHTYSINMNTPCIGVSGGPTATQGSMNIYSFALFERNLAVTSNGIEIY